MNRSMIRVRSVTVTLIFGLCSLLLVAALVLYPAKAFEASIAGLQFWWNIVFPALLPYLILVKVASVYGLFGFARRALSPLLRLLGLPRGAAVPVSASLFLGYAAGAGHAVSGEVARKSREAETNAAAGGLANPVLVMAVLASSLLQNPAIGFFLLPVHYMSWLIAAFIFARIFRSRRAKPATSPDGTDNAADPDPGTGSVQHADRPKPEAPENGRPRPSFGQVLGDSVTGSLQKLLELGGLIILFAVLLRLFELSGIPAFVAGLAGQAGWPKAGEAVSVALAGFLEIHNGLYALARSSFPPEMLLPLLGAVLAWGGFAVHLEVRALLRKAGIGYRRFLAFRLVHAALAFTLSVALWPLFRLWLDPWKDPSGPAAATAGSAPTLWPEPTGMPETALLAAALIALLLIRQLVSRAR